MPPVFMQPGGDSGGGGGSYSQLASALQSRYAADAERNQRGQIAYQQMADQRIAEQQNFELSRARLQLQPILQEQQARNEMDNWTMKQQFNQQDHAELNRQNAIVSELMDKRDKGEISDGEFYAQVRQRANRVNVLQAKEQHTNNAALQEQRKMRAADFEDKIKMRDRAAAYQDQELEGKLDLYVPPRYARQLSEMMADGYPELKSGTPEYKAQLKGVADEMGWATPYAKDKNGTPIHQKEVMDFQGHAASGQGGARAGKAPANELDAAHVDKAYASARAHVLQLAKEKKEDGTLAHPDLQDEAKRGEAVQKAFDDQISATTGHFNKGKEAATKAQETAVSSNRAARDLFQNTAQFPPEVKARGIAIVDDANRLAQKYPPGNRPKAIADRLSKLATQIEQLKYAAESYPKAPQQAQAHAEAGAEQPSGFTRLEQRVGRGDLLNAQDMPESFGDALKRLNEGTLITPDTLRRWYERK